MTQHEVPDFTFESDADVEKYLNWLIENGKTYHFDDDIEDAFRNDSEEVVSQLKRANDALWSYCDPWDWFDNNPESFKRYRGD